jgi:hypothetical protein
MSRRRHPLFPDDLSDEAAAALCDFFFQLATACESHYLVQLRRHVDPQRSLYEPEEPWRFPHTDPRPRQAPRPTLMPVPVLSAIAWDFLLVSPRIRSGGRVRNFAGRNTRWARRAAASGG